MNFALVASLLYTLAAVHSLISLAAREFPIVRSYTRKEMAIMLALEVGLAIWGFHSL